MSELYRFTTLGGFGGYVDKLLKSCAMAITFAAGRSAPPQSLTLAYLRQRLSATLIRAVVSMVLGAASPHLPLRRSFPAPPSPFLLHPHLSRNHFDMDILDLGEDP